MAVIKVCSVKTPFSKKSYPIEIGQLICKAINLPVSILIRVFKVFPDYSSRFLQSMLIFKKQSNIGSLKIPYRFTLPFRLNSSK